MSVDSLLLIAYRSLPHCYLELVLETAHLFIQGFQAISDRRLRMDGGFQLPKLHILQSQHGARCFDPNPFTYSCYIMYACVSTN